MSAPSTSSPSTSSSVDMSSQPIRVRIDPFLSAVASEDESRHFIGDNDGEHLMGALAAACAKDPSNLSSNRRPPKSAEHTLGSVPFQLVRVEVDAQGKAITPTTFSMFSRPLGETGYLYEYLRKTAHRGTAKTHSRWRHEHHPESFSRDYPYSVDNFDCERFVEDLEDDNDLVGYVEDPKWVLWAALGNDAWSSPSETSSSSSSSSSRPSSPTSASPPRAFAVRDRINLVEHFHEFLNNLRCGLAANKSKPVPTVYFIVACTYPSRHRMKAFEGPNGEMLAPHLNSTLLLFQRLWSRAGNRRCSVNAYENNDDSESDSDSDFDYTEIDYTTLSNRKVLAIRSAGLASGAIQPSCNGLEDSSEDGGVYFDGHESESDDSSEHRPSTPPPPSILQTLDTNAAKGDAVEGDLHALLPEAQSPEQAAWEQCCKLLCIDPEEHKDAQVRSVKIPGTDNMMIKPSQLWTAYWMLTSRTDRGLCGGVLADVMGTGKTYVCLVVCLLRAYIGYNRAEVEREWQLRDHEAKKGSSSGGNIAPKQHLPRNVAGTENVACPCGNAMGIECYANPGGVTRFIADGLSRGASLILAPQTVLDNWVKTVKHVRLQHKFYEPVVFHSKMSNEDIAMAPAPRLKQKLQMGVRPQPHVSSDGLFSQSWEPNVMDVVHDYTPSIAKDAYPERFIFLSTHMPEKLTEFFQLPVPVRRKAGASARERKTVYGCPIGIQLVDEFHKAKDDVISLALQHKHLQGADSKDNFDFWAITGTPLPAKLTDLEKVTDILQRLPQWDDAASPHHDSRVVALRELQMAYEKAVAEDGTPDQAADFRARAERFFKGGIIKRHTESSMFFGQRIFNLQDVTPQVVVHTTPDDLRDDVSKVVARVGDKIRQSMADAPSGDSDAPNWEQAVRSSSLFNHMMDLEILATFPGAAPLMLAEPPVIDFGLAAIRAEIRQAENHDATKVELFQTHLDTIIANSPHLDAICQTIDEMKADRTKRRALPTPVAADAANKSVFSSKKVDLSVKKLVVLCPRMGEAIFVYLALRKLRPEVNAVFLHADLKLSERTALLQDFNRLDAPTPAGINHTAQVLVGTFRDAGTGNDLTVANYQILTGPLRLRSQQDQAFGRTNREGQTLRLHHRLLVTEDSPVDRIVMVTQARRQIVSNPFAMDEELVLADVEEVEEESDE